MRSSLAAMIRWMVSCAFFRLSASVIMRRQHLQVPYCNGTVRHWMKCHAPVRTALSCLRRDSKIRMRNEPPVSLRGGGTPATAATLEGACPCEKIAHEGAKLGRLLIRDEVRPVGQLHERRARQQRRDQ